MRILHYILHAIQQSMVYLGKAEDLNTDTLGPPEVGRSSTLKQRHNMRSLSSGSLHYPHLINC